jgi:uncharacterized protein (TIGR02217 family)
MILNAELEPCIAPGFTGGPVFNTLVYGLRNGQEFRNANWDQCRHQYSLPFQNIKTVDDYLALKRMFLVCRGMLHGFLFMDPGDFEAANESIGVAPSGSTPVQIVKVSTIDSVSYTRIIQRPVPGFVVEQSDGVGGWAVKAGTVDANGKFTPSTAWTAGRALRWSGEFRIPVRFNADELPMTWDMLEFTSGSVSIIEVFGE